MKETGYRYIIAIKSNKGHFYLLSDNGTFTSEFWTYTKSYKNGYSAVRRADKEAEEYKAYKTYVFKVGLYEEIKPEKFTDWILDGEHCVYSK
jgi:hypothetical protein